MSKREKKNKQGNKIANRQKMLKQMRLKRLR